MSFDWSDFVSFEPDPSQILRRRSIGQIYRADFNNGKGMYISTAFESDEPYDMSIQLSPRIELRLTYILNDKEVQGIQITKLNPSGTMEKLSLTTMDWQKVLALLKIFDGLHLESIASGTLVLDAGIVDNPEELKKLLMTIATDQKGKEKLKEVADNFGLLMPGGIKNLVKQRENVTRMEQLITDPTFFLTEKTRLNIGKDEQVWQEFFQENEWLLGSEVVEILDERGLDEHSTVDLPVRSVDGFLDIIELKLPDANLLNTDLNPSSDLTKALMQCMRYLNETEKRANDHAKVEALGCDIVKPRITLVMGRSDRWSPEQHKQLRILNSSFHNITILTYDHVLQRALKIINRENNDS